MMHYSFSWQTRKNYRRALVGCCIFLLGLGSSPAYANPFGGTVVAGQASIQVSGNTVTITQGSNRAVINWQDFSIGANQVTKFNQNSSSAATLNRVTGGNPSAILGKLQANGQVFLINPNGIVVGPGAQINVGAFTASTLDIDNAQFMRGGALDFRGDSTASVINHGNINAVDGGIYLIGAKVENHGLLNAPNGTVGLAAGQHVRLADSAKPHLVVKATSQSIGGTGVLNTGTINALRTELAANGGNVYGLAINNTGTIRATGVETVGGEVYLTSRGGTIQNTGNLIASSVGAATSKVVLDTRSLTGEARTGQTLLAGHIDVSGETGGVAHILGDHVSLTGAEINANGLSGGGQVLIGGGFQGSAIAGSDASLHQNAVNTSVDAFSNINASAVDTGNGGQVIVWADDTTTFAGNIFARGGANAGNGGFAEVSGKQTLAYSGLADLRAPKGEIGTIYLDPNDVEVNLVGTVAGASLITPATIVTQLALGNTVIHTEGTDGEVGNIFINEGVLYTSANSLSFLARGDIRANAPIQNDGMGDLSLVAGWDGATGFPTATPNMQIISGTFDFAAVTADPTSYGIAGGSVSIGNGMQTAGIAVGSRFGATNVAADALTVTGSNTTAEGFAQLGFRHDETMANFDIDGSIDVALTGDLVVTGGNAIDSYA
ncbi:MAG: filamentous hemagglutinin N-terminal domain-containing protein, partial [bacterium]|nr:filamentous hemagglutinin N-terminal domain-containing protein [bacterium]